MPVQALAPEVPTLVLNPSDRAPSLARRFLAERFREWGHADDYIGRLVVTELVTNAYLHGEGVIVVRVFRDERAGLAVIEVWDQGAELPFMESEDREATSGRGLLLMAQLVQNWGTRPTTEGGKIVWATCALEAPR